MSLPRSGSVLVSAAVHQFDALHRMVQAHTDADSIVLDVGAGDGHQDYIGRLRPLVRHIVGIDPAPGIRANQGVDERFQSTLEEFAPAHGQRFDVAIAIYVVEHVSSPLAFLAAMHRCLKPGGSAFILTPNVFHYFGAAAFIARRLHVDEWVIHRVRDQATVHEHHVPVEYRMNSRGRLTRCARRAGFRTVEFHMLDEPGIYQPYLPARLKTLPVLWSKAVHRFDAAGLAGTMLARLEA